MLLFRIGACSGHGGHEAQDFPCCPVCGQHAPEAPGDQGGSEAASQASEPGPARGQLPGGGQQRGGLQKRERHGQPTAAAPSTAEVQQLPECPQRDSEVPHALCQRVRSVLWIGTPCGGRGGEPADAPGAGQRWLRPGERLVVQVRCKHV